MAVKWTKKDVIEKFQEALQPTEKPSSTAPRPAAADAREIPAEPAGP